MQVKKARARAAAQVLVAAADGEIDVERRDVDRKHAERVVDVEQHASAGRVRRRDDVGRSAIRWPVVNITCETTTRSARAPIAATMSAVSKRRRRAARPA